MKYIGSKFYWFNIQGYDVDVMTQEDIDKSIEYLFPSGLAAGKYLPRSDHLYLQCCNPRNFYYNLLNCRGKACYETTRGDFPKAERCRI